MSSDGDGANMAGLEDAVLEGMDAALAAVQNDEAEPLASTQPAPSDSFPELASVEDTTTMVEGLLQTGEERSKKGDVKGALAAFNKAIALDPASDMAWFNRGVLLEAQQDARGARQAFQICLDLNEDHAPATANMAILLERIGDLEGAHAMATKALSFYPGHPMLVELQSRTKDSGLAVPMEAMKPSLDVQQTVDMEVVQQVAEQAGIEDTEALLQEAMHHDHDHDDTISAEELESAAAVVVATQSISQDLNSTNAAPSAAVAETPKADEPVVDLDALSEQATNLLKAGQAKEALQLLKPHLKTVGAQHANAWRVAGGAMARMDLDTHAMAAMSHAQNLDSSHAAGWFNLGSIQQRNDLNAEAIQAYKRAMSADASYLKAGEKMAALAEEKGWIEHYLDACRSVTAHDPTHPLRQALIDALLQLASGEHDVLEHAAGLPPTVPAGPELASEALTLLEDVPSSERARALSLSLQHSDAVLMWKGLIQADQHAPGHWTGLARALERAGDEATAAKCHAKAAALGTPEPVATPPLAPNDPLAVPVLTVPNPEPSNPEFPDLGQPVPSPTPAPVHAAADLLMQPVQPTQPATTVAPAPQPQVDLAKAALDAAQTVARTQPQTTTSSSVANQDIAWFNQGVQLIEDGKYREALSSFDKALPAFAGDDEMIIRILNNRGNAFYFLEEYPKCVEAYHQAMTIRPTEVRGETLYNMGTAYAEMERYNDAIKCFEQAIPRGLDNAASKRAKDQIRRCRILQKALEKKMKRRR